MNKNIDELSTTKYIVKKWEANFAIEHKRKPEKEDLKKAPKNIREAYSRYCHLKTAENKPPSSPKEEEESTFGAHLNKKQAAGKSRSGGDRDWNKTQTLYSRLRLKSLAPDLSANRLSAVKRKTAVLGGNRQQPTPESAEDPPILSLLQAPLSKEALQEDLAPIQAKDFTIRRLATAQTKLIRPLACSLERNPSHGSVDPLWLKRCGQSMEDSGIGSQSTASSQSSQPDPLFSSAGICSADSQRADSQRADSHSTDFLSAGSHSTDSCSADIRSAASRSADSHSVDTCSRDFLSAGSHSTDSCNEDSHGTYTRSTDSRSVDTRSAASHSTYTRSTDSRSTASHSVDTSSAASHSTYTRSTGSHSVDTRSAGSCSQIDIIFRHLDPTLPLEPEIKPICQPLAINDEPRQDSSTPDVLDAVPEPTAGLGSQSTTPRMDSAQHPPTKRKLQSPEDLESSPAPKKLPRTYSSQVSTPTASFARARLEKKLESGTINENYVKVNLKKKKYVRGHKHRTGQQIKRAKWKAIQKGRSGGKKGSCFKCKKPGHWAQDCPQAGGGLLPVLEDGEEEEDGDLVTLEQAAASSSGDTAAQLVDDNSTPATQDPPVIPASQSEPEITTVVEPLYQLQEDGQPIDTPLKVSGALYKLGFEQFRAGQEEAVMRILSGQSTLAVLPTGAGKSLIYQLPAYLYAQRSRCFTLVVSPLVALMENQVLEQPPGLVAASLHSGQDPEVRRAIMEQIKNGEVQVLLTSPETLVMGGWTPPAPVAFACLDEVHCLSHSLASHFRPAYLQVLKVLKERLGVRCILGLTATGTQPAMEEVARRLGGAAIVGFDMSATPVVPANILVSVSRDPNKDQTLVELFNGPRFSQLDSILVYCTRREETERLAMFLRTSLQGSFRTVGKKKVHAWDCEAFHAGLTPYKKKQVQQKFSSGRLRVVVATVALGMGLHHAKLGGVVHYDLPASPERYVQEVGRAGRNGNPAHCHLLLSPQGWDLRELRRHVYANSVDRSTLRRLLNKVFKTCNCQEDAECPGHEVALPLEKLVEELDLREQTIMTLLSWLELAEQRWLEVKPPITAECLLRCYGGASQMAALAQKDPVVREALSGNTATGSLTFNVVDVAAKLGFEARHVKKTLKQLEWDKQGGRYRRSGFLVEFSGQAAHLVTRPGLGLEDRDAMLDHLHATVREQESHGLRCLLRLHALFHSISQSSVTDCLEATDPAHGQQLREALRTYFTVGELPELPTKFGPTPLTEEEELNLRRVVSALVGTHHDHSFTPRAVARILHGIESPQFPAVVWGRVRGTWRSCLHLDFPDVLRVAAQEMRYLRG